MAKKIKAVAVEPEPVPVVSDAMLCDCARLAGDQTRLLTALGVETVDAALAEIDRLQSQGKLALQALTEHPAYKQLEARAARLAAALERRGMST